MSPWATENTFNIRHFNWISLYLCLFIVVIQLFFRSMPLYYYKVTFNNSLGFLFFKFNMVFSIKETVSTERRMHVKFANLKVFRWFYSVHFLKFNFHDVCNRIAKTVHSLPYLKNHSLLCTHGHTSFAKTERRVKKKKLIILHTKQAIQFVLSLKKLNQLIEIRAFQPKMIDLRTQTQNNIVINSISRLFLWLFLIYFLFWHCIFFSTLELFLRNICLQLQCTTQ